MKNVKLRRDSALMVAVSILALSTGAALAGPASLPTGGAVTAGAATITSPNATTTVITQSGGKAILTWNDFSIAAGNKVQFNNGAGSTLNRVTTGNASEIDGTLSATGSVYLINPNGIVIGKTGVINTGGTFVASTLDISNAAFLAGGSLTFSGSSTASVTNLGQIGSSGGDVVLIAKTVENDGSITAAKGDAGLLAGSSVTLLDTLASGGKFQVTAGTASSATNTGSVAAATAELRAYGGNVYALAGNGGGAIAATGISTNDGQVFLTAQARSGATGVGDVTIAGGVSFTGGANALTIDAFHNAHIDSVISTTGGHVTLTANDGGVGGDYDFGLTGTGFAGAFHFLGGAGSGESLKINGQSYTLLYSITNIQNISNYSGYYALANNIDASVTSAWNAGSGFVPIATTCTNCDGFSGVFEGVGNNISKLYINQNGSDLVGLFAVTNNSIVRDVGLLNVNISGELLVGGITGDNFGTILNAFVTGSVNGIYDVGGIAGSSWAPIYTSNSAAAVSGTAGVGGLVGENVRSLISNSSATGAVTGIGEAPQTIGGLAGFNNGTINGSYATGSTSAEGWVGGLVGQNDGSISTSYATGQTEGQYNVGGLVGLNSAKASVTLSYASGAVIGGGVTPSNLGGFVGTNQGTITDAYALGAVTGGGDVGGFVGNNNGGTVTQAYATGAVSGQLSVGGFAGANGGTLSQSYWDSQTSNQSAGVGTGAVAGVAGLTTAQFGSVSNFVGWTFTTTPGGAGWVIVDQDGTLNNAGGAAGATRPLLASEYSTTISNGHQLQLIAMNLGASYIQANDISLSEINNPSGIWITSEGFSPIGNINGAYTGNSFNGQFDGRGHVIDGLTINGAAPFQISAGLFSTTGDSAVIENVNLTNVSISGGLTVGGLVGTNHGLVENSSESGVVSGGVTPSDYLIKAYVFANDGGLIGDNFGAVLGSTSSGSVSGGNNFPYDNVGGLVGGVESSGSVSGSHSSATVSNNNAYSSAPVGGLVGWSAGTISNSYATGVVSSNANSGGKTGGLLGEIFEGSVTSSYATGSVTGGGEVGGLVGKNDNYFSPVGLIASSYATGAVSGGKANGGLVGENDGMIQSSYATGPVAGSQAGALVGYNPGEIQSGYWNTQTSGLTVGVGSGSSAGATGLTTAQMLHASNFAGFDFSSTGPWRIVEGSSFPYLSWQFVSTPDVISGTVYSGIGGSTLTGLTVAGYENGSSLASTTSGANGYYQFLLPQGTLQNAAVVTYLTGAPQKASALATGVTGSVTGLNLYEGTFFVETGLTTLSSLPAQISAATGGAAPDGLLLYPGHAFLGGLPANTNVWINASGAFTIDQRIDLGTGSLVIDAGGAVSQTSTALIQAGSLSGASVGGANFIDPANWIGAFSWSNTGAGGVVFGDTEAVHIGTVSAGSGDLTLGGTQSWRIYDDGALTAGGNISLNAAAGIDLNAQVTAGGAVSLTSSQGGFAEYGAGAISAASLSGSGLGANLSGANMVATITGFSAPQGFVFNNTGALNITGPINASGGYLYLTTTVGDLDIDGALTAGINASLRTAGNLALDSTVTAPGKVALNATGSISETGSIIAGTLLGGSNGSAILTGANRIGTLGGFSVWHGGATLSLTDVTALTVTGAVRAGSETFVDAAGLTVTPAGSITALGGGKTLNGAALH